MPLKVVPQPSSRECVMSAKYILTTALISLATVVAYEHYKAKKG